jgi:hypothetical protein
MPADARIDLAGAVAANQGANPPAAASASK